jgi:hypothetical protein
VTDERQERAVRRLAGGESQPLMVRAFVSLPDRWRTVLWYTDIEHASAAETASLLGLTSNSISTLKRRATEALRQAYLQTYLASAKPDCVPTARRLVDFVRGALSTRDTELVADHIGGCVQCRAAHSELSEIHGALRRLGPLFVTSDALGVSALPQMPEVTDGPGPADESVGASAGALWSNGVDQDDADLGAAAPLTPAMSRRLTDLGSADPSTAVMPSGDLGTGAAALGPAAASFASSEPAGWGSAPAAGMPDVAGGSPGPPGGRGRRGGPEHAMRRPPWVPIGIGLVVVGAVTGGLLVALGGNTMPNPSHHRASSQHTPTTGNIVQLSPTPAATPSHVRKRHSHAISPSAQPSATVTPIHLAAAISLFGPHGNGFGAISFQVTDTGSDATDGLVATISLPPGSNMTGSASGDWSCQATSGGATCQHGPISAGQQIQGTIMIQVMDNRACGHAVALTVSSAGTSVSAQSAQSIRCQHDDGGGGDN